MCPFTLPAAKRIIIWLNITVVLGEFLQLCSYLICKGGGLGTVLTEESKKKEVMMLAACALF